MHLLRLNGPQIKQERPRVLTRETKRRHIRMADREPFAQSLHERIKIHATIKRAKGGGTNVRTLATPADGMTLRAHAFRQSTAALLQRTGAVVFGQARRCCDEQKKDGEPHDHLGSSPLAMKKDCRSAHWFGFGRFGGGASVMVVLQLRHENVSNCALCSSDLLLSIAMPQSGQCRSGGCG
jgi:hypothetical protein